MFDGLARPIGSRGKRRRGEMEREERRGGGGEGGDGEEGVEESEGYSTSHSSLDVTTSPQPTTTLCWCDEHLKTCSTTDLTLANKTSPRRGLPE